MDEIDCRGVAAAAILGIYVDARRDAIAAPVQDKNPPIARILLTFEKTQTILSL